MGIAHVHPSVWSLDALVGRNIDTVFIQKGLEQGLLALIEALPVDSGEIARQEAPDMRISVIPQEGNHVLNENVHAVFPAHFDGGEIILALKASTVIGFINGKQAHEAAGRIEMLDTVKDGVIILRGIGHGLFVREIADGSVENLVNGMGTVVEKA